MAKSKQQNQNSQPAANMNPGTSNNARGQQRINNRKRTYPQQMSNVKKLIPFTEVEWKYVQEKFMSEDEEELTHLCGIMNMWICRMFHDTPVFIGITELMLRALVIEQKHNKMQDQTLLLLDNTDVGLIYCSVIIRFVNYVNEICQPEGQKMLSIANAVQKMGIPNWIVSIRHKATHEHLPPMNLMKEAIKFCRTWLWKQHWSKPLTDAIKQIHPEIYEEEEKKQKSTLGIRMLNALQRFREWRKRFPSLDELHMINSQRRPAGNDPERCRQSIESILEHNMEAFIKFIAINCLAIKMESAANLEKEIVENGSDLLREYYQGEFSKVKQMDKIIQHEQIYYKPIFILMNQKGCLPVLLTEIVRLIAPQSALNLELNFPFRCHLAGWADILLSAYLKDDFANISIQNWKSIFKNIVLAPQFFHNEHIKSLIDKDIISKKRQRKMIELLKINELNPKIDQNQSTSSLNISTQTVKTLADLQNRIRFEEMADHTFVHDPLTMENDWSLASPSEFGAMGLTSDQRAETLCLALGIDLYL